MMATLGRFLRWYYRPWIRGTEHVPSSGPAILASNHLAVIDSFFLPALLKRPVVFLGKDAYFTGRGIRGRVVATFMRGVGTIPVDRSGGSGVEAALRTGLARLEAGELFGIYPEGTRSPDGRLYRGKTGIARLALESGAPVVPVAMVDSHIAQPIGKRIPSRHRVGVVIGAPLDFSRYRAMASDRFVLRTVTDEIMYAIMGLSGQEYVDGYAASEKSRMASRGGEPTPTAPGGPGGRPAPGGPGRPGSGGPEGGAADA
ncbi:lysophospholipid acyltransferase family protein [Occultella kanbiaonis]|uniref:lysophospholipid acyltransferase family protein n=1 Tax=Occultella kanbiaonis TaxID=2675754 RepID=UPI0012B9F279|nr:lysophospholipid acyltransferase family protein [Occultella kanbiaonis]